MSLLNLIDAELAFGLYPLLDRANFTLLAGERVGLIGRNGTGKSSLLQVIAGRQLLDSGEIQRAQSLIIVHVEQEPILPAAASLRESLAIRGGLTAIDDDRHRWRIEARLDEYLHRFGLEGGAANLALASGGERKRAALALAFALEPALLLLDEPTNHLDIDGIALLEEQLSSLRGACIVITHDRWFLDRVVTRIVELDRGSLRSYPGNWSAYELQKADQLAAEALENRRFDKFWAQEEVWIRKGVEARRTRNEGRVKRLESLRSERAARRDRLGNVQLNVDAGERSGKLVAELEGVSKSFAGSDGEPRAIIRNLSLRIMRGDHVGIVGPNAAGKSTLIKLILGSLQPDSGTLRLGSNLQVAYFDQLREQLDPDLTVAETISPGSDWIEINGQRKHVATYLADFLFPARRAKSPIRMLSGGERNRLLLARLFARPANLLVLDEPTNDLDIESLELLEQMLQDYPGTLLLVSHDRAFLDNVVTQVIAAEGDGRWREFAGGYSDWLTWRAGRGEAARAETRQSVSLAVAPAKTAADSAGAVPAKAPPRMSFKELKQLESLPAEIEALEAEQQALVARMSDPQWHKSAAQQIRGDQLRIGEIEKLLAQKFARWEELEARRVSLSP